MRDDPGSTQKRSTCNRLRERFGLVVKIASVKPVDNLIVKRVTFAKSLLNPKIGAIGDIGFASKVMDYVGFGFAARCEAVALPRR